MARKLSEERTRKEMKVSPFVGGIDPSTSSDYCLYRENREGLAVVEAKYKNVNHFLLRQNEK